MHATKNEIKLCNMKSERQSNFEILRLILMYGILVHHCIVLALGLSSYGGVNNVTKVINSNDEPIFIIINSFLVVAVDTVVLISGYFGIRLTLKKVLALAFSVMFYTLLFNTLPMLLQREYVSAIGFAAFPITHTYYWFIREYVFLMILSPLLNISMEKLSKRYNWILLGFLIFLNCYLGFARHMVVKADGFSFVNFLLIYMIGRFLRVYPVNIKRRNCLLIYAATAVISGFLFCTFHNYGFDDRAWSMTFYSNPLVIIGAIFLFLYFERICVQNKFINKLSQSALSVFLFSSSSFVSEKFYGYVTQKYVENPRGGGNFSCYFD